MSGDVSAHAL